MGVLTNLLGSHSFSPSQYVNGNVPTITNPLNRPNPGAENLRYASPLISSFLGSWRDGYSAAPAQAPQQLPSAAYATVAPTNIESGGQLSQDIASTLTSTPSNLGADFYQKAAANTGKFNTGNQGLYQLSKSMWDKYGNGGDQSNTADNIRAYIGLSNDNYSYLQSKLGRAPTQSEVYMANQLGQDAALRMLTVQRNTALDSSMLGSGVDPSVLGATPYLMNNGAYLNVGQALNNYYAAFL